MGSGALVGPANFAVAKKAFEKKFRDKSSLPWTNRLDPPKDGKYTFLEMDYEDDEGDDKVVKKEKEEEKEDAKLKEIPPVESTLPEPVQQLVALIFNQEYALQALQDLNFDANKLPLGKLSKRTLQAGFQVLKELSELINDPSLASNYDRAYTSALELLSNRYFTIIPHAFGRNRPPVITQPSLLKKEVELLDNLTDMEISNKIFRDSLTEDKVDKVHLLDKQFQGLNMDEMTPCESSILLHFN
jgi:poly [ADP-ribose] polymerase 2/3/4